MELAHGECLNARTVVVAAGAIGSPMLLHASGIRPVRARPIPHLSCCADFSSRTESGVLRGRNGADLVPRLWIPPTAAAEWNTMVLRDVNPLVPSGLDLHVDENRLVEIQSFCPVDVREENAMRMGDDGTVSFEVHLSAADQGPRAARTGRSAATGGTNRSISSRLRTAMDDEGFRAHDGFMSYG